MKTLPLPNPSGNLTRQDKQAAVERTLYEIRTATTSLFQQIDDADPREAEMMRAEAARLNGIGFTLTRLLCLDDVETAYRIVNGDLDECGEVLGLTASNTTSNGAATTTTPDDVLAGYEHFGVCPECGKTDGYLNLESDHWFICHAHQIKWRAGSNLFSSWRDETEEDWQRNWGTLEGYRDIAPHHPKPAVAPGSRSIRACTVRIADAIPR